MKTNHAQLEIAKAGQCARYVSLFEINSKRFRVTIVADSVDYQSRAIIETWHRGNDQWNPVAEIHYTAMATNHKLAYVPRDLDAADFDADREELIRLACFVTGIERP